MVHPAYENAGPAKTRVQLDLPPTTVERLNWIMQVCEIGSRRELFDNALTVLEWTVNEVTSGRKVVSLSDADSNQVVLSMPILQTAARSAGRSHRVTGEPVPARRRREWMRDNLPEVEAKPETGTEARNRKLGFAGNSG